MMECWNNGMMGLKKSEIKENITELILLSLWGIFGSKVENNCPVW